MRSFIKEKIVKKRKNGSYIFDCDLSVDDKSFTLHIKHSFNFIKYHKNFENNYDTLFTLSLIDGDFTIDKTIDLNGKVTTLKRKNSFLSLMDLSAVTLLKGYKDVKFWGVKYRRVIEEINDTLKCNVDRLVDTTINYFDNGRFDKFYRVVTDFHLHRKEIKPNNGVYYSILFDYPLKKYLKKNNNKYLSAVLEKNGIKNKYYIGLINTNPDVDVNVGTLKYLSRLFGDNYIDYVKSFDIIKLCAIKMKQRKCHEFTSPQEKNALVHLLRGMVNNNVDDIPNKVFKLIELKNFLVGKGMSLSFSVKNCVNYQTLYELWNSYKKIYSKGYILKYDFPQDMVETVEEDIIYNGQKYSVRILKSEEDFREEGRRMKNCMGNNSTFCLGQYSLFLSVSDMSGKTVNVQIKKGKIIQMYGKANTEVKGEFPKVIGQLLVSTKPFTDRLWKTIKIDIRNEKFDVY